MQWAQHGRLIDHVPGQPAHQSVAGPVYGAGWAAAWPSPVPSPHILACDPGVVTQLGLTADLLTDPGFTQVMGGNALYAGMTPWAANYGGHQFGHWAGQLGDGRALSLGELIDVEHQRQELQLKGAGPTPFSRGGDGRAVLRSSLREFVCSQAMAGLGVPTTAALCLVATGQHVVRDILYDGHPAAEPGAIVCRVAPSFLRFGSLQLPVARGELDLARSLMDFAISRHYPALAGAADRAAALFAEVARRSAVLVAHWQRVGFVHAVLNTDNLHLAGLTIDYGPFGWMEAYDPDYTPNTSDSAARRYRFAAQPAMVRWNLGALAQALSALTADAGALADGLAVYDQQLQACRLRDGAAKLGLHDLAAASALHARWQALMAEAALDMSLAYRALAHVRSDNRLSLAPSLLFARASTDMPRLQQAVPALSAWLADYRSAIAGQGMQGDARAAAMNQVNPWFVPRNWLLHRAADEAAQGDLALLQRLCAAARDPYRHDRAIDDLVQPCPAELLQQPGCSRLSCSS